jgi:hypothetical protein
LLGELVVPEELVVPSALFPKELDFFTQLVELELQALPIVVIVEGMPLLIVVLARKQPGVVLELIQQAVLLVIQDFYLLPQFAHFPLMVLQVLPVGEDHLPDLHHDPLAGRQFLLR